MRRDVIDAVAQVAGAIPVEHVVVDLEHEGEESNVLVIANETVAREAAPRSNSRPFAALAVQLPHRLPAERSDQSEHPEAERRLRRALAVLRGEGLDVHGQIAHPDPYMAVMHAVHDERVDEIVISTFAGRALRLVAPRSRRTREEGHRAPGRAHRDAGRGARGGGGLVEAHAAPHDHGHAEHPPIANVCLAGGCARARDAPVHRVGDHAVRVVFHGLLLHPRVGEAIHGRFRRFHLPVFVAGVNTAILVTSSFTMHWALQSIKRGNRAGLQAGLVLTFFMGLAFLLTQATEYARVGFAPHDGAFGDDLLLPHGLHGAHVFIGLTILLFMTIRAFRGHFSPEHHHGVEIGGIYWHFVDVMWIVVYRHLHPLGRCGIPFVPRPRRTASCSGDDRLLRA